jgi:hypothetical protein
MVMMVHSLSTTPLCSLDMGFLNFLGEVISPFTLLLQNAVIPHYISHLHSTGF